MRNEVTKVPIDLARVETYRTLTVYFKFFDIENQYEYHATKQVLPLQTESCFF